MYINNLPVN